MSTAQTTGPVYALLADGSTVEIRPAGPADFDAVKAMHEAMSPDDAYLRFFGFSRTAAETEARRMCREPRPGQVALLALVEGQVVGCGSYETIRGEEPDKAEVAFAVADRMHHKGIATLLLEHLVSYARSHQITTFTGQTPPRTPRCSGVRRRRAAGTPPGLNGVVDLTFPLPGLADGTELDTYLTAVAEREARRGGGQPAARVRTRVGGGDRRQQARRHGRPGDPGQHPRRRIRRKGLRGQPARPSDQRRTRPGLCRRPARAHRPGGDRGARGGRAGSGGAVRAARRARHRGDHLRARRRRPRRPARDVPPSWHAADRPELLRRRGAGHRP